MEDNSMLMPPPPVLPETPVQQFRNAVKIAAQNLLFSTGIAVSTVEMNWNEPTTGERQLRSMQVSFTADEIDANWIWCPEPPPIYPEPFGTGGNEEIHGTDVGE